MADQIHMFMLDALLDTRLATIHLNRPDMAVQIVNDPEVHQRYLNRPNDHFTELGFAEGEFEELYKKRNADTLVCSIPTMFLFELTALADSLLNLMSQEPHQAESVKFLINTYPYSELTEEEIVTLIAAVGARLPDVFDIQHCYRPPHQLSPQAIRAERINAIYFYNFYDWLKCHYHKDVVTEETVGFIPGVSIFTTPHFLDIDQLQKAAEFQNPNGVTTDPINGLKVMFSPFFRLEPIRMEVMSIVDQSTIVSDFSE